MTKIITILFFLYWTSSNCFGQKYSNYLATDHLESIEFYIVDCSVNYHDIIFGRNLTPTKIEVRQATIKNANNKNRLHTLSINPMKPFLGLLNLQYEFQFARKFSINLFSEYLAYTMIKDFEHPDMVNKFGFSFYPMIQDSIVNYGLFINLNVSHVSYFRDNSKQDSFTNGIEIGYKWISKRHIIIQPKGLLNYQYSENQILPGFEVLFGYNF